ncbi:MAG: YlxR family protein [Candidatus Dormibacteraeota bacterium]|nr:YlxR family protein [Candidatus Dormibacteraeota bacterium]
MTLSAPQDGDRGGGPRTPNRTCLGCREEAAKRTLTRLVRGLDGTVRLDRTGRAPGRGAYLHPSMGCIELARRRRALERALKAQVDTALWGDLETAARREAAPATALPEDG